MSLLQKQHVAEWLLLNQQPDRVKSEKSTQMHAVFNEMLLIKQQSISKLS
jgi:hypothetical protein